MRWTRTAALTCALLGAPAAAQAADTVYATTGTQLLRFSTATPGTIDVIRAITGLNAGETVRSIDVRPATGVLYGITSATRLVSIDQTSGAATVVGTVPAVTGTDFGIDFNPTLDRIRLVTSDGASYRVNPNDATVAGTDTLASGPQLVSVAYDRNAAGGTATTLFAIDSASDELVRIGGVDGNPNPNLGAVTSIGPLGLDVGAAAGFDVSPNDTTAYASLAVAGTAGFASIDLTTGAAKVLGALPDGVTDIAVAQPRYTGYAAFQNGANAVLVRSRSDAPNYNGNPSDVIYLDGLAAGERIVGLDQRPATGDLVALTSQSRLYVIGPDTGIASRIGSAPFTPAIGAAPAGFDFNPTADRARVVDDAEQNLRLNPITGALAVLDTPLNPVGDVTAAAYTNSFAGATATTLFDIDSGTNRLLLQDPPNAGTLTQLPTFGDLKVSNLPGTPALDVTPGNGFDIAPAGGSAFLVSGLAAGNPMLYRILLTNAPLTQRATLVGSLGVGLDVDAFAVMSPGTLSTGPVTAAEAAPVARIAIVRSSGTSGRATVEYATVDGTAKAGEDYTAAAGLAAFAPGEKIKLIDVPLLQDTAVESDETFALALSRPGEGALVDPAAGTSTVTIVSDDLAPVVTATATASATATVTQSPTAAPTQAAPTAVPTTAPTQVADTTKPLAFVTGAGTQTLRGIAKKGLRLQLVSGEPSAATVTVTVNGATKKRLKLKSTTLGTATSTFTAAGVQGVTVTLPGAAKKAARKAKKAARVRIDATVTDLAGNASTSTATAILAGRR